MKCFILGVCVVCNGNYGLTRANDGKQWSEAAIKIGNAKYVHCMSALVVNLFEKINCQTMKASFFYYFFLGKEFV